MEPGRDEAKPSRVQAGPKEGPMAGGPVVVPRHRGTAALVPPGGVYKRVYPGSMEGTRGEYPMYGSHARTVGYTCPRLGPWPRLDQAY